MMCRQGTYYFLFDFIWLFYFIYLFVDVLMYNYVIMRHKFLYLLVSLCLGLKLKKVRFRNVHLTNCGYKTAFYKK